MDQKMKRIIVACTALSLVAPMLIATPASAHRGWRLPDGSWSESCRRYEMRGPVLVALCRAIGGGWYRTRIDVRNCRSGSVANANGNLVCS
jgi:hypothetical protein